MLSWQYKKLYSRSYPLCLKATRESLHCGYLGIHLSDHIKLFYCIPLMSFHENTFQFWDRLANYSFTTIFVQTVFWKKSLPVIERKLFRFNVTPEQINYAYMPTLEGCSQHTANFFI